MPRDGRGSKVPTTARPTGIILMGIEAGEGGNAV
jgi:hypothetical protein